MLTVYLTMALATGIISYILLQSVNDGVTLKEDLFLSVLLGIFWFAVITCILYFSIFGVSNEENQ